MTSRERYEAVLAGDKADHYPRIPILMQFAAEYIGSNYGAFASDYRVLVEANLRCARDFGLDQLSCISDPYRETTGFGAELIYHKNSVPECVEPPLEDIDDVATLKQPDPLKAARMLDRIQAIQEYRAQTGDEYSVLGWIEGPAALSGDVRELSEFLMDLMEDPEACRELLDLCTETGISFALAQLEAGADTIGIGEAICSQISPAIYRELVLPHHVRLMRTIKEAGGNIRLHICGQTEHLWQHLRDLPFDIFDCDHMVDMGKASEAMQDHVALEGNLDPVAALRFGTADTIRQKVQHCALSAGPRFMVGAGCEVPSGTPIENLQALCEPVSA